MANKKYKLANSDYWATDGVYDLGQSKTQRTINSDVNTKIGNTTMGTTATTLTGAIAEHEGDIGNLNTAIKRNIFTVEGTLISNVSSSGNIFTQSTASDSRITSSTKVANVIFDIPIYVSSMSVVVTPGTGTVTITGTTVSFAGTVNVVVELYNT